MRARRFALATVCRRVGRRCRCRGRRDPHGRTGRAVTGPSPFAACPDIGPGTPGAVNYLNDEVEPWVAVNPAEPLTSRVWQQAPGRRDGGARGLATGYSTDGGATWNDDLCEVHVLLGRDGCERG